MIGTRTQAQKPAYFSYPHVVLEGILTPKGMASFSDVLTEEDTVLLHEYVRARAHQDREVALGNQADPRWTWLDSVR